MPKRSDDNSEWSPDIASGVPANTRAADFVFEKLAGAILRYEMKVGTMLPGERELADKFGISRVIIREAIHKLKELELVRVKQGGQTVILDPALSANPRLIPLVIELATPDQAVIRETTERTLIQGLALLELAEGRLEDAVFDELDKVLDTYERREDDARDAFIREFWTPIAKGTGNQFIWRETLFWFQLAERHGLSGPAYLTKAERLKLHRDIVAHLRTGTGATKCFRDAIRPVMDALTMAAKMLRQPQK